MALPAPTASADDPLLIELQDQPLAAEIADYVYFLAMQNPQSPLSLTIKVHPLNIAEGLAHELAAHERNCAAANEKCAAHEFADQTHPHETATARRALTNMIAEMVSTLADATLAHHMLFILTLGKKLPAPFAMDRLGICASFDGQHRLMHKRFAPGRELIAPIGEAPVAAGMTLVCEPMETGYYRIPDDKRYRHSSGLNMEDSVFNWSLQTLTQLSLVQGAMQQMESLKRDGLTVLDQKLRAFLVRFLMLRNNAEAETATAVPEAKEKIVFGRFAGNGSAVQVRNVEHRAGSQMLERSASQLHHPVQHAQHLQGNNLQPE